MAVYGMVELGVNPVFAKTVFGADGTIGDGMDVSHDGIRVSKWSSHRTLKQAEDRHALRQLAAIRRRSYSTRTWQTNPEAR